jgi:hypothetical protein
MSRLDNLTTEEMDNRVKFSQIKSLLFKRWLTFLCSLQRSSQLARFMVNAEATRGSKSGGWKMQNCKLRVEGNAVWFRPD